MTVAPIKTDKGEDSVFAHPSFYAEFAPRDDQAAFVDSIYILKDRGRLTESRISFASPLKELAFVFREGDSAGKVVFNEPSLNCRRKGRAFFGWIVHRAEEIDRSDSDEAVRVSLAVLGDLVVTDHRPARTVPATEHAHRNACTIHLGKRVSDRRRRFRPFAGSPPTQRLEYRIPDPGGIRMLHPGVDDHILSCPRLTMDRSR